MDAEGAKGRKPTNLSGKRTECGAYIGAFFSQHFLLTFSFIKYRLTSGAEKQKGFHMQLSVSVCTVTYIQ